MLVWGERGRAREGSIMQWLRRGGSEGAPACEWERERRWGSRAELELEQQQGWHLQRCRRGRAHRYRGVCHARTPLGRSQSSLTVRWCRRRWRPSLQFCEWQMRLRQRGLGLRIYVRATIVTRDDLIAAFEFELWVWVRDLVRKRFVQRSRCFRVRMWAWSCWEISSRWAQLSMNWAD